MLLIRKPLLLILGVGVMSIWAAVVFVLFTNGDDTVSIGKHIELNDRITSKQEVTFDEQQNKTNKVYVMRKKKESVSSAKLDSIMVTNDNNEISIDVLLEKLEEPS